MKHSNFKKTLLAQTIALASVGTVTTLHAQESADATGNKVEELVITGIRGSLKQALNVKQNSDAVVDAINSEDIGKFPDKNVADSLQRIPGISVDRIWGEGRDIFVRGTDSTMNRTLMNGQNVASAYWWANDNPSRGFNYTILASELVSSLEVYKSAEADIDEGSIGGTVIVRTRKPMDLDPLVVNLTAEAVYSELPDKTDPQLSGLVSWTNQEETFGILASINSQERNVRRDGLETFPDNTLYDVTDQNGNTTNDVYAVWGGGSAIFQQENKRLTTNLTMQYKPTSEWDIVLNYVNSDMDSDNSNQNYLFMPGGYKLANGDTVTDPHFIPTGDGKQAIVGGTFENPNSGGAAIEPIFRDASVESSVLDLDVTFIGDGWQAHGQAGSTSAEGGSDRDIGYWFEGDTREVLNLEPNAIEIDYLDLDPTDASALTLMSARDWIRKMEDEENYLQGDLEFDLNGGLFTAVKLGVKFRDETVTNRRTAGATDSSHPGWQTITMDQVSTGVTPGLHGEAATSGSLTRYAWLNESLAKQIIDPMLAAGVMTYTFDERAFYEINEKISAAYVKGSYEIGKVHGNIGLRAITTDQTSKAYIDGEIGEVSRDYTDVLPSINLIYDASDDVIVRAAASKAMARPTFQNLSSNLTINATTSSASGGNPDLDPTYANQFEVGAEWYFAEASILSATFFAKQLDTFVYNRTQAEVIDGDTITVTRPYNAPDGADIQGLELQWQQELGLGFGVVANYTYTDAEVPSLDGGQKLKLPGNSDDQLNTSVYFEDDVFSVRLSYNYRSEAFGALTSGSQMVTDAYDQWDATADWAVSDMLTVFFTGVNLTNEVIYMRTDDGLPVGFYENGARYSLGVRAKF
ncbi:Vitamin B12 transporter BtuB [Thalassocella blandensis]|nr:Vitamin B12 transporter BtuB [Thalassocella blandensis]